MKHKYIHQVSVCLLLSLIVLISACKKDEVYTEYLDKLGIELHHIPTYATDNIAVVIYPDEQAESFRYAIGKPEDAESFKAGTLSQTLYEYGNKPIQHVFEGLEPDKVYAVFAQALDAEGNPSELAIIKARTDAGDFGVQLNQLGATSATITILSSTDYQSYVYGIGKPEDVEAFRNGTLEGIRSINEKQQYSATFFGLEEETDYYIFVMGYNRVDEPTPIYQIPITTLSKSTSPSLVGEVEIDVESLLQTNYHLEVNEHCSLSSLLVLPKGEIDWFLENGFGGNILNFLHTWTVGGLVTMVSTESELDASVQTTDIFFSEKPFELPYEVYVLLYDEKGRPANLEYVSYQTPKFDESIPEAQVEVEVTDITDKGATYKFQGDEHAIGYFFETFDADWFDGAVEDGSLTDEDIVRFLQNNFFYNNEPHEFVETTVPEPGFRVYLLCAGVNKNGFVYGLSKPQKYEYVSATN